MKRYVDDMGNDNTAYVKGLEEEIDDLKKQLQEAKKPKIVEEKETPKPAPQPTPKVPKKKKYSNIS